MKKVTEDKTITLLAVLGMAAVVALAIIATVNWIAPFMSVDLAGNPTLFGQMFAYVLYIVEALAAAAVLWMMGLAIWKFIPTK